MKKVIDLSQIVEAREVERGTREVIATAEGQYDEALQRLELALDSRVLVTDRCGHETPLSSSWQLGRQIVHEALPQEEAPEAAKDIFHRWAEKVRQGIPHGS